jgi:hypothetical protein
MVYEWYLDTADMEPVTASAPRKVACGIVLILGNDVTQPELMADIFADHEIILLAGGREPDEMDADTLRLLKLLGWHWGANDASATACWYTHV